MEARSLFQCLEGGVPLLVLDAEQEGFPVQFVEDVVQGISGFVERVLKLGVFFRVSGDRGPERFATEDIHRFPRFFQ